MADYMQVEGLHSFLSFGDNVPDNAIITSKDGNSAAHRRKHFIPVPGGLRPDYDAGVTPPANGYGNYILVSDALNSQLSMSYWIDRCLHFGSTPEIIMGTPASFTGHVDGSTCAFIIDVGAEEAWFKGARNGDYLLELTFENGTGIYFESAVNELTVQLEPVARITDLTGFILPDPTITEYPFHTAYDTYCAEQMSSNSIYHTSKGSGSIYLPSSIGIDEGTEMTQYYGVGSTGMRLYETVRHTVISPVPTTSYEIPEPVEEGILLIVTGTGGVDVTLWRSTASSWFGVWLWDRLFVSTAPNSNSFPISACETHLPAAFTDWEEVSLGADITLSTNAVNHRNSMDDHYQMIVRGFDIPDDGIQSEFYIRFNREHTGVWDFLGGLCISAIPDAPGNIVVHDPYVNGSGTLTFSSFVGPLHPDQALALLPRYGAADGTGEISLQYGYTHPVSGDVSTRESIWANSVITAAYHEAVSHQNNPGDTYVHFKQEGTRIQISVYLGSQRIAIGNISPDQTWFASGSIAFYFFAYSDHGFSASEHLSDPVLGYMLDPTSPRVVQACGNIDLDKSSTMVLRSVDFLDAVNHNPIIDHAATFVKNVPTSGVNTNVDALFDGVRSTSTRLAIPSTATNNGGMVGLQLVDGLGAVGGVRLSQIVPADPEEDDAILKEVILERSYDSTDGTNGAWETIKVWVNVTVDSNGDVELLTSD